eukprot:4511484-Pyramimonas_sp.AAC.1
MERFLLPRDLTTAGLTVSSRTLMGASSVNLLFSIPAQYPPASRAGIIDHSAGSPRHPRTWFCTPGGRSARGSRYPWLLR